MPTLQKSSPKSSLQDTIKQTTTLLKNWDKELVEEFEKTEIDAILEERLAEIKAGKTKFDSWENAQKRILAIMTKRLQKKG
ncbi:MAG: hypothetical protein KA319_00135 [Ferruginibacter sp.]|nr:hypothetical protein [Ferruginibacter sp.]